MELKTPDGYILVSNKEIHNFKRVAHLLDKFRTSYYVFNRQLNSLFKDCEEILKENKEGLDDRSDKNGSIA
jgi:hypothetical protein